MATIFYSKDLFFDDGFNLLHFLSRFTWFHKGQSQRIQFSHLIRKRAKIVGFFYFFGLPRFSWRCWVQMSNTLIHLAFIRMKQEVLKKLKYFLEKVLLLEWNKRKTQMAIRFFCCRAISKTNWNLPRFPPTCFAQTKVRKICCINCSCFDLPLGMVIWNAKILVIVYLIWSTRKNRLHTGLPRLVHPRTIKLTTFFGEKTPLFFWQFLDILGI